MLDKKLVSKYLKQISQGEIKSKDAAVSLGITQRHLNRITKREGVHRPEGERRVRAGQTILRTAAKKGAAEAYGRGIVTIERAASIAGVSTRTISRWSVKLGYKK